MPKKSKSKSKSDKLMDKVEKCIIKHGPKGKATEKCIEKAQQEAIKNSRG